MSTTRARRLVLQCDRDGCVMHADAESSALLGAHPFGELLPLLLDTASAAKCERFLQRVRFGGAFGWELHLRAAHDQAALLFAGQPLSRARLLVVAAETPAQLLQLLDACCAEICDAGLAIDQLSPEQVPEPVSPLDELMRVNSALLGLQRELAKRNAELAAITKQRNELLAVAAHDLRNPLLVVQGYCDMLTAGRSLAPDAQRGLERVQRAASLMQHVLEDTLEYARLREVYLDVIQCAQHELGRLWQLNRISVAQEHYCTAVSQLVLAQLYPQMMHGPGGEPMVATCAAEELHELGARMVADFFELDGWDTTYVGANAPAQCVLDMVRKRRAGLLAISATMGFHVHAVLSLIEQVRSARDLRHVKILVGGRPFSVAGELWRKIGADGCAADAEQAVNLGRELLGLAPHAARA